MLKADGFDEAFIGVCHRFGQEPLVAYDYHKCIAILCERDGMSHDEAIDFFFVNVLGSWVGEQTPVYVHMMQDIQDLTDEEHGY